MASFQMDFDINNLKKIIDTWLGSITRKKIVDANKYYDGENVTVSKLKRMMWSDKHKRMIENTFVANNKISYNKYHDIVSQKVNTLLNEIPVINNFKDDLFVKNLGYALKQASIKASNGGSAFIYCGYDNNLVVFDTENCIPFYDDENKDIIKAFIRFWDINSFLDKSKSTRYVEVYEEDGLTIYTSQNLSEYEIALDKQAYKFKIKTDIFETQQENIKLSRIPIVELKNNDNRTNDFTTTIRSKIDMIDILNSGFANNIEDFTEIFWIIKNGAGLTSEELEDFVASINMTKKAILEGDSTNSLDIETKQIEIPVEARTKYTEELKTELIDESGIIDTAQLTGSSLTTTAIKASTMKLRQRVSDFEWFVYVACKSILNLYNEYNNISNIDYDIEFTKLLIDNDTEIITNAIMVKDTISQRSYLSLLKRANIINNVDDEIKEMEKEQKDKYTIEEVNLDDRPSTQANGQDIGAVGEETEESL